MPAPLSLALRFQRLVEAARRLLTSAATALRLTAVVARVLGQGGETPH